MSTIALKMFRMTALGASNASKVSVVKLGNVVAQSTYSGAFSRCASSSYPRGCYYSNSRYTQVFCTNPIQSAGCSLHTTLARPFSNGRISWQQKNLSNEQQENVASSSSTEPPAVPEKLGLFARFKKMYKEYWYVLVPVHCLTSVAWFGGFYYASTSGVDVIAILESLGVSETLINPVRDSSLGHIAIAYLLYKIATPARYTVTLGGTTISIKYLEQWGYIKPIPSKARLVQMYKDKKENIQEKIAEKKQDFKDRKQQLTDKKNTLMNDLKADKTSKPASSVTENK